MFDIEKFLHSGIVLTTSPGRLLVGYGAQYAHASPNLNSQFNIYSPDFFLTTENPWISYEFWFEMSLEDLQQKLHADEQTTLNWLYPDFEHFSKTFHDLKKHFAKNELNKGVPFSITTAANSMSKQRLSCALNNVLNYAKTQPVYVYGMWNESSGILGATPEILFKHSKNTIHTMACAGTRSAAQGNPESLLEDKKERYEHKVVVQGIKDALQSYGDIIEDPIRLMRLPNLVHLLTPITVKVNRNVSFDAIMKALHPTPALGAWPRQAGWNWLINLQKQIDRMKFGAPFGYIDSKRQESCCYVAIRNVQWTADHMMIAAGCGVVPDSILENEWQEVLNKIAAIKHILNL